MTIVTCEETVDGGGWTLNTDSGELCFNVLSFEDANEWVEKKDNYADQVKTVFFEEDWSEIASHLLEGCRNLTSVTVNGNVTSIGANAFYGCRNLTSISISSSVETIADAAFAETDLTSVTLGCGTSYESDSFPGGCIVIQPDHTYANGVCTVCGADDPNCISIAGTKLSDGESFRIAMAPMSLKYKEIFDINFTFRP